MQLEFGQLDCSFPEEESKVDKYAKDAISYNTQLARKSDLQAFRSWCIQRDLCDFPTEHSTVGAYLADNAENLSYNTLKRRLSSIVTAHKETQKPILARHPDISRVMAGIRRFSAPPKPKKPILTQDLLPWIETLSNDLRDLRDKAMILLCFAGALRRSELVGLDVCQADRSNGWIEHAAQGLLIHLARSKTHVGSVETVIVPNGQAVNAVHEWLTRAGLHQGPLFTNISVKGQVIEKRISARTVARKVKQIAKFLGKDVSDFSAHSLRAGFATQAAINGASEREIQKQTRHKSLEILRGYIRDGQRWQDSAASKLGL